MSRLSTEYPSHLLVHYARKNNHFKAECAERWVQNQYPPRIQLVTLLCVGIAGCSFHHFGKNKSNISRRSISNHLMANDDDDEFNFNEQVAVPQLLTITKHLPFSMLIAELVPTSPSSGCRFLELGSKPRPQVDFLHTLIRKQQPQQIGSSWGWETGSHQFCANYVESTSTRFG